MGDRRLLWRRGIVLTQPTLTANSIGWNTLTANWQWNLSRQHPTKVSNDNEMMYNKIVNSVNNGIEADVQPTRNYIHHNRSQTTITGLAWVCPICSL